MNDYLRDRVAIAVGANYQIEREVGRGGMAVVYQATDTRLHRTVAIKVLPPDLAFNPDVRTRFIREAQTAAQLSHPNIVPIYSVEEKDGESLVYFVMAFIDGESVGARLAREGAWPIDATVRVLRDVADALAYAHARGVVHRDIKPDNILLDRASGRPMVTDFGIARAAAGDTRLTATGVAVGTPAYMSPEQAIGERELDGRSDLYSLGVVGYHMLAGDTPFAAKNTPAMLVKHVSARPRPLRERRPEVPAYLAVAIDRALAKRPEDRWADAAEFRDALDGAQVSSRSRASSNVPSRPDPIDALPAIAPISPYVQPIGLGPPVVPFPLPPTGLSRQELKHWYRTQRRLAVRSDQAHIVEYARKFRYDDRPLDERVIAFRRSAVSFAVLSPMFFAFAVSVHTAPFFFLPSAVLLLNALRKGGSIWSDGIGPIEAFSKGIRKKLRAARGEESNVTEIQPRGYQQPALPRPQKSPEQLAAELAPADVLAGPHGDSVRRAAVDRKMMKDIAAALRPIEREMIPEIGPTVDALAERVGSLATTLHRLDTDVSGANLGALDQRIASMGTEPNTPERERRLTLLQRQRASLHDLLDRRGTLANQLESASLMLQNLKFDLLKLRSSGIGSAIEDSTSMTQEARALSRDIGNVVDAAEELKKIR
ncbi:MAG: serine/threonine-protein kinase [Gemmatimonadaceae bacterium]